MPCDAQSVVNLLVSDGYLRLSDRDKLLSMCGVLSQEVSTTARQAVIDSYSKGYAKLSDRQIDEIALSILCPTCTVPAAPTSLATVTKTSTTIQISWSEPGGQTITGFKIKWGTSSGNYNTGSATVGSGTFNYTATGLSPSTQYFFVVQALNGGCASANSVEFSDSTTAAICTPGMTFANAWAARVVANGGAMPSQNTINQVAIAQCSLIAAGLDSQMIFWDLLVPDSLIATFTPQKPGDDGTVLWTNNNFTLADLAINGLKGNGTNKFITPGAQPVSLTTRSAQSVGIFALVSAVNTATNGRLTGGLGTNLIMLADDDNTNACFGCSGNNPGNLITLASPGAGFYSDQRVSAVDHRLYYGNIGSGLAQIGATDTTSFTGAYNTYANVFIFGVSQGGSFILPSNARLSAVGYTLGLNLSQVQTLMNIFQTARIGLGGGSV